MTRLHLTLLLSLALSACSQRAEVVHESSAEKVNFDCKEGRRTGPTCEAASRALEAAQHRDAQAAFRNMVEKK